MKTRLEQFTVAEFVDLACGDMSVLSDADGSTDADEASRTARSIMLEYKEIADPGGFRRFLAGAEEAIKARITLHVMTMCRTLIGIDRYANVRAVLDVAGVDTSRMSDARVRAEVVSRIGRAKASIADYERNCAEEGEVDVRRRFDEQSVAMMTHFQFQIDPAAMKATIYAHMVARYVRDVKAMERASMKGHQ